MVIFDPPIFFKQNGENKDVIVFAKSPELRIEDSKKGLSRFGGVWREPYYLHAYFRSADILLNQGVLEDCLDDIGLPLFYMQRHTTELLIKGLLSWVYEIAEFRAELGLDNYKIPSKGQQERFKSHKLTGLFNDLASSTKKFGFQEPPPELDELVKALTKFEKTETWSRYSKSKTNGGKGVINHVQTEVALPVVELQELLKDAISKIIYKLEKEDAYEYALYDKWLSLARATGSAG